MYYRYMTVYKKKDESLVYKATKCKPKHRVGDRTTYGWKVVEIQRIYNGHIYSIDEYNRRLTRRKKIRDIQYFFNNISIVKLIEIVFLLAFLNTQIKIV